MFGLYEKPAPTFSRAERMAKRTQEEIENWDKMFEGKTLEEKVDALIGQCLLLSIKMNIHDCM